MRKRIAVLLASVLLCVICMPPAGAEESTQPEILAVYYCPDTQIVTGTDQSKELADTVLFLYQDDSYVQYVDHDHRYEVYSRGSYECNFDWKETDWQNRKPHILTVHIQQIHGMNHQLQPIDQTYDVNLDKVMDYCLYPDNIRTDLKLVAAFMQTDKQKLVKADGNEEYLSTIWFYYDDGSFQQYAVLGGQENVLFSCGDYSVTDGLFRDSSVLTIHRTKKYQDGTGLADYDSTHDYPIDELDFIRVYPAGEDGEIQTAGPGEINREAFDALVAGGPVADDASVAASLWASGVRERGSLRVGTTVSSTLFSSQENAESGVYGFDAGLYQLLARYIFGDASRIYIVHVTSPLVSDRTREGVLLNDAADAVFSTYSILPERQEIISFAGPYFSTRQAVLVKAGEEGIAGYEDLAGKRVAVQYGTSVIPIMAEFAPDAELMELNGDDECLEALAAGKADAYVCDFTILASAMIEYPNVYEIRGDLFGPNDNYGVGLQKDSDGVAFINDFLRRIEEDGTWAELWKICFSDRIDGAESVPEPPAIP